MPDDQVQHVVAIDQRFGDINGAKGRPNKLIAVFWSTGVFSSGGAAARFDFDDNATLSPGCGLPCARRSFHQRGVQYTQFWHPVGRMRARCAGEESDCSAGPAGSAAPLMTRLLRG
jgi:hypothetical protein